MSQPRNNSPAAQLGLFHTDAVAAHSEHAKPVVARVLVEETALELDYVIPKELAHRVHLGSRVHVPLQGRRAIAVVIQTLHESTFTGRLKPIADVIGTRPMFPGAILKLAQWISSYYLCPLRHVLRPMLPEAVRTKPESFLSDSHIALARQPTEDELEKLRKTAPIQARILELLQAQDGEATLSDLRKELPRATQIIHVLAKKGLVTRSEVRVERDPFGEEEFIASA